MNIFRLNFWTGTQLIFFVAFIMILPFVILPVLMVGLDNLVNKGRRR